MVKRLHLGRAAESGVLAAQLAARGYDGPRTVLEGEFGVLDSFCSKSDPDRLTARLGTFFETSLLCIKPYACHVTAQAPIELLRALMAEHGFAAGDIAAIEVAASEKVASHHGEQRPADVMLGQYSVPFSLAVAAWRDPADPTSFADDCIHDAGILDLAARIEIVPGESGWGAGLTIALRDGRRAFRHHQIVPRLPGNADVARRYRSEIPQAHARQARHGCAARSAPRHRECRGCRGAGLAEFLVRSARRPTLSPACGGELERGKLTRRSHHRRLLCDTAAAPSPTLPRKREREKKAPARSWPTSPAARTPTASSRFPGS